MDAFKEFLSGEFKPVKIDLENPNWHTEAKIPPKPGWYYITTTAPLSVLQRQTLWQTEYTRADGETAKVGNYDIAKRSLRFTEEFARFWNTTKVYSGIGKSLQARAREHTFPDPGTAGLALAYYSELYEYEWVFNYRRFDEYHPSSKNHKVHLLLGEQIWREQNGWPLLCAG